MTDKNGNRIDLDRVDAVGKLDDGLFDIWMCDETRVVTDDPKALIMWRNHIRSKLRPDYQRLNRLLAISGV